MSSAPAVDPPVVLLFHADLYPLDALERAAAAFSASARVRIVPGSPHHQLVLESEGASDRLARELANFALATAVVGPAEPGEA